MNTTDRMAKLASELIEMGTQASSKAYEAGRLAAVRADVADFVGWCEREAEQARCWAVVASEFSESGRLAHLQRADAHAAKAADCRRWLEATS